MIRAGELKKLLKALERAPERYLMVYLASEAGLRLTEACCMRLEDLAEYEDRKIYIRIAKKSTGHMSERERKLKEQRARLLAKGRRNEAARLVYRSEAEERPLWPHFISSETVAVLKKYFRWKKVDPRRRTGWLFPGRGPGGRALEREVHNWFTTATKRCGIGRKTFHCLRHYRGFTVQDATHDITITKDELRHASVAVTQMYVNRRPEERIRLADEINQASKGKAR
jgi:integrase